jgi:hypothetical protein
MDEKMLFLSYETRDKVEETIAGNTQAIAITQSIHRCQAWRGCLETYLDKQDNYIENTVSHSVKTFSFSS